jgi:hypothetical protein
MSATSVRGRMMGMIAVAIERGQELRKGRHEAAGGSGRRRTCQALDPAGHETRSGGRHDSRLLARRLAPRRGHPGRRGRRGRVRCRGTAGRSTSRSPRTGQARAPRGTLQSRRHPRAPRDRGPPPRARDGRPAGRRPAPPLDLRPRPARRGRRTASPSTTRTLQPSPSASDRMVATAAYRPAESGARADACQARDSASSRCSAARSPVMSAATTWIRSPCAWMCFRSQRSHSVWWWSSVSARPVSRTRANAAWNGSLNASGNRSQTPLSDQSVVFVRRAGRQASTSSTHRILSYQRFVVGPERSSRVVEITRRLDGADCVARGDRMNRAAPASRHAVPHQNTPRNVKRGLRST